MTALPRILVIDDLFGRTHAKGRNEERANLCGQYLLKDVTGEQGQGESTLRVKVPTAEAVFFRGQSPLSAGIGDVVENDLEGTLAVIRRGWTELAASTSCWALVLLDLCFYTGLVTKESDRRVSGMPVGRRMDNDPRRYFGLEILSAIRREFPDLPVIIMSSMPREAASLEFSSKGALGFLRREDPDGATLLKDLLWRHGLIQDDRGDLVGSSKELLFALRTARRASSGRRNTLIRGERGVGKDLLARYINRVGSGGADVPLITVNSAILSPTLYASELFGIERRVATGVEGRRGLIVEASRGDLFLDEIRDMAPEAQAGILRVLEERKVTPVGAKKPIPVDVRFISATNSEVEDMALCGRFRPDLLDRLREGGTINLPALRDRREDIPALVERFLREAEDRFSTAKRRTITDEVIAILVDHEWPGNVRELKNAIFEAVQSFPDVEYLVPAHIAPLNSSSPRSDVRLGSGPGDQPTDVRGWDSDRLDMDWPVEQWSVSDLAGKLPTAQAAFGRLVGRLLKAAIVATRRASLDEPDGRILIHPAMKLLTGNRSLSASKAADLVKRLVKEMEAAQGAPVTDPVVKTAHEISCRLRPAKPAVGFLPHAQPPIKTKKGIES